MTDAADAPEPEAEEVELPSLSQRIEWFEDWEESTAASNELARRDRDYYDNKQWSDEHLADLKERGQPPLVKNRIARKVNFILGEEIKKRVDPVAHPRTKQHEDGARAMTDALRYVEEQQEFDSARSAVARNMLIEGFGGSVKGIEQDEDGTIKHTLTHAQWDRLFYDPHSREPDFSDAKFKGTVLWMDVDDAITEYPGHADDIEAGLTGDIGNAGGSTEDTPRTWYDRKRKRVKIVEMYFRVGLDWYRADFTKGADLLPPERTAYLDEKQQHSLCPLIMASCYVDQEGMRYGVVRQLISPQDEVNKRASKALHLLSVRQVVAERDFIRDPEKFQRELAKPDGYAEVEPGGMSENRVKVSETGDLAQGHVAMMQQAISDLDSIGPSSSTMPDIPQAASGVAFQRRQTAASQELGGFFDSLKSWTHAIYELDYLCIRQFWTEEIWMRVTDDDEMTGYRFVALNRQMTRAERFTELLEKKPKPPMRKAVEIAAGTWAPIVMADVDKQHQAMMAQLQQSGQKPPEGDALEKHITQMVAAHPMMTEQITENQVDQLLMDIVIDEAPDTAILAQEEFQTLTDLLPTVVQSRPDMAAKMVNLVVKASSLPNKRDLLKLLEEQPKPDPAQQVAQQLQMEQGKVSIAVGQSQAQLNAARAASEQAKTQMTGAKVPSEIGKNEAQAQRDGATAQSTIREMMTPTIAVIPGGFNGQR